MGKKPLSFRTQIFFAALLIMLVPNIIFGVYTSQQTASQAAAQYQQAQSALLRQASLSLNTLLADVQRLGNLHFVNTEVRRILYTDYSGDDIGYAKDFQIMRDQVTQARLLNVNVVTTMYVNRYGFHFDYYMVTHKNLLNTLEKVAEWREYARDAERHTYFGPIQHPGESGIYQKTILPIVTVLYDSFSDMEIGAFYMGVDFDAIRNVVETSEIPNSRLAIFGAENQTFYAADKSFLFGAENEALVRAMEEISGQVSAETPSAVQTRYVEGAEISLHAVYNETTSWAIVSALDNAAITGAYWSNIGNTLSVFLLNLSAGLLLALLLSRSLTGAIGDLCAQIDACEDGDSSAIALHNRYPNRELQKVMQSYNSLNHRLSESMEQNYSIRLEEKQARLRMLQLQINPHFFYNTLNLISALANIHNVPEIQSVAGSMSDILRYSLRSGFTVRLSEELEQVRRYLGIQELRFPGKFQFEYDIPTPLLPVSIPPFILQPLAENCINHGFRDRERDARISFYAYQEGDDLLLLVSDNGMGIPEERLAYLRARQEEATPAATDSDDTHVGVFNVHQRLRTYYGAGAGLLLESVAGSGTIVTLRMPIASPYAGTSDPP